MEHPEQTESSPLSLHVGRGSLDVDQISYSIKKWFWTPQKAVIDFHICSSVILLIPISRSVMGIGKAPSQQWVFLAESLFDTEGGHVPIQTKSEWPHRKNFFFSPARVDL